MQNFFHFVLIKFNNRLDAILLMFFEDVWNANVCLELSLQKTNAPMFVGAFAFANLRN
jgi:hypothetical protein